MIGSLLIVYAARCSHYSPPNLVQAEQVVACVHVLNHLPQQQLLSISAPVHQMRLRDELGMPRPTECSCMLRKHADPIQ